MNARRRAAWAVGVSLCAHALVVASAIQIERAAPAPPSPEWVELALEIAPREPENAPAIDEASEAAPRLDLPPERIARARVGPASSVTPGPLVDVPAEVEVPATVAAPAGTIALAAPDLGARISPAAVARAAASLDVAPAPTFDERLSGALHAEANARAYLTQRPPPRLERRSDGTWFWDGPVVRAIVEEDGTARFLDPHASVELADHWMPVVRFDITDALERRHGNDPYAAEKRWFLDATEEMRSEIGAAFRARLARHSGGMIRRRLETIWRGGGSPAARRREIFEAWDECEEDESGRAARAAVLGFIHDRLGRQAYPAEELARLNAERSSAERFAPNLADDDAHPPEGEQP